MLWLFLMGIILGVLVTIYILKQEKFAISIVIPFIPALYFITKGLYINSKLFIKEITAVEG